MKQFKLCVGNKFKKSDTILGLTNTEIKLFELKFWVIFVILFVLMISLHTSSWIIKRKGRKSGTAPCLHNHGRKKSQYKHRKIHLPIACYQELPNWGFFCATLTAAAVVHDNKPRMTVSLHGEHRPGENHYKPPIQAGISALLTFDACRSHRKYSVKLSKQM